MVTTFQKGEDRGIRFNERKGIPLDKQKFDWRDIVRVPTSKLDDDAFTRVRIILMNGIESEVVRFQHVCARVNKDQEEQEHLENVRRWLSEMTVNEAMGDGAILEPDNNSKAQTHAAKSPKRFRGSRSSKTKKRKK